MLEFKGGWWLNVTKVTMELLHEWTLRSGPKYISGLTYDKGKEPANG